MADLTYEPMLEMFIFETTQLIEQLEQIILESEQQREFKKNAINEIFRIMHTIKGSSSMMMVNEVACLAHVVEDVFYWLREFPDAQMDCGHLSDLILKTIDFIKTELGEITAGRSAQGSSEKIVAEIREFLAELKNHNGITGEKPKKEQGQQFYVAQDRTQVPGATRCFTATVFFEDNCDMENIRAFTVIHNLQTLAEEIRHYPEELFENDAASDVIRNEGFHIGFTTNYEYGKIQQHFSETLFMKSYELKEVSNLDAFVQATTPKKIVLEEDEIPSPVPALPEEDRGEKKTIPTAHQSIINVSVAKLDKLMDLVGELVIAEAMVTQNPELQGLVLTSFSKAARQLRKITGEVQDTVMSIRMVPLATTFQKMHRVVRDMSKKLGKKIQLELVGEATEVDKNIIENISDPLMHLIRNAIDHGIEPASERIAAGKPVSGTITLEARNAGSEVFIIMQDDGRGLDRAKILNRARQQGMIYKPEADLSDQEIYSFILNPGFSTKEQITEFSGRGVGMDVVTKNINAVGGTVHIQSAAGRGTTITLKIPLTLAIINGVTVSTGKARFTLPTTSIQQMFRSDLKNIFQDPDGNEMILIRGQCHPIFRLHKYYKVPAAITDIEKGILVLVENENHSLVVFADQLLGEQQVVVKPLPEYLKKFPSVAGLTGCTLLGDGSISLILDVAGLIRFSCTG